VIDDFMIQGGGFDKNMRKLPTDLPITNEANNGLKNEAGTIAMARTSDPHSATAQFFINVKDNDFLNYSSPTPQGWGYAVFGKVTEGIAILGKIKLVKTGSKGFHQDVPVTPVVIHSVELLAVEAENLPCPICNGVEGCDDTALERERALANKE
jgi:peptidyl-prolyl cis-trans isomerase B (cyclophilin B)